MICMIGVLITTRLSLLLGSLWVRDKKFICVYTYTYIHLYFYIYLSVDILKTTSLYWYLRFQSAPQGSSPPFPYLQLLSPTVRKLVLFYLQYYIYCSILVHIKSSFKIANPYPCEKHIWQTTLQHLYTAPLSLILQYLVKVSFHKVT